MEENQDKVQKKPENLLKHTWNEVSEPFINLFKAPKALWGINLSYLIEGLCYFGILGLLTIYFNEYVGLNDVDAGRMVGILTGGITLAMVILGGTVDRVGVRKAFILSLLFMLGGRILLAGAPVFGGASGMFSSTHLIAMGGILGVIIGYGIYQPAAYAAVKKFTDAKNAAMGYAMLYAIMNLGGFLPGLISPPVRHLTGITGVFWVYVGLTVVGILFVLWLLSQKNVESAIEKSGGEKESKEKKPSLIARVKGFFTDVPDTAAHAVEAQKTGIPAKIAAKVKESPFMDSRFMFFIFILIPVQTLFAHNWLTLPQYCERAFEGFVSEYFEFFVNLNPILIFILTPTVAALTSKKHTYKMMISGTIIMALSPFILVLGTELWILLLYIAVLTIGEAMWQPRFLQWVAEIAPKGKTGIYMGLGQFPWFLTKILTSMYSGWFLMNYLPKDAPQTVMNPEYMWMIYGLIAIASPLGLILARKWMLKGFKERNTEEEG
ncbi:MAG: MFS transporter [Bacteroidota bacterium]